MEQMKKIVYTDLIADAHKKNDRDGEEWQEDAIWSLWRIFPIPLDTAKSTTSINSNASRIAANILFVLSHLMILNDISGLNPVLIVRWKFHILHGNTHRQMRPQFAINLVRFTI